MFIVTLKLPKVFMDTSGFLSCFSSNSFVYFLNENDSYKSFFNLLPPCTETFLIITQYLEIEKHSWPLQNALIFKTNMVLWDSVHFSSFIQVSYTKCLLHAVLLEILLKLSLFFHFVLLILLYLSILSIHLLWTFFL